MVRIATEDDVLSISLVARLSLENTYQELLNEDVKEKFIEDFYSPSMIAKLIEEHKILIVENEDNLTVGFLSLAIDNSICEIVSIYILPNYQGQGYGKELLETLMSNDEIKEIYSDVESRNIPIQKFYSKRGFEIEKSYPQDLYGQLIKLTRLRYIK